MKKRIALLTAVLALVLALAAMAEEPPENCYISFVLNAVYPSYP